MSADKSLLESGKTLYGRMKVLLQEHTQSFIQEYQNIRDKVERTEYGSDAVPHRGYYHPSPVRDIVFGRFNRGKLLKNPVENRPMFIYGFDVENHLILCEYDGTAEYLLYEENRIIGIQFCPTAEKELLWIDTIYECVYDDFSRIISYSSASSYCQEFSLHFIEQECFSYGSEGIEVMEIRNYTGGNARVSQGLRATFHHNKEGYIISFYEEEYDCRKKEYGSKRCITLLKPKRKV